MCTSYIGLLRTTVLAKRHLSSLETQVKKHFQVIFCMNLRRIQGKKGRKGFHTTHKSKIEGCLVLKRLVEQDKIRLKSKMLVIRT